MIYQTFINRSDDFAEMRAARAEDRDPAVHGELKVTGRLHRAAGPAAARRQRAAGRAPSTAWPCS